MTILDVYNFIKEGKTYFLSTVDQEYKPHVRPFGTIDLFEGKLYIQSGKKKEVHKQIINNPYVEISSFVNGKWIRLSGKLVLDERVEAKKHMLDAHPSLRSMYNELDDNTAVYYFESGKASIESFINPKEELVF